jgi:hypothetical protein
MNEVWNFHFLRTIHCVGIANFHVHSIVLYRIHCTHSIGYVWNFSFSLQFIPILQLRLYILCLTGIVIVIILVFVRFSFSSLLIYGIFFAFFHINIFHEISSWIQYVFWEQTTYFWVGKKTILCKIIIMVEKKFPKFLRFVVASPNSNIHSHSNFFFFLHIHNNYSWNIKLRYHDFYELFIIIMHF